MMNAAFRPRVLRRLASALAAVIVLAGCSMVGMREGTEEPRYAVHARAGEAEIRDYEPRHTAETFVAAAEVAGDEAAARNAGFRRLAGYIFGGNSSGESIAMTAPVAQTRDGDGWRIRFFLPADRTWERPPAPNDPDVGFVRVPGERMAVLRFTGDRGPTAVAAHSAELLRILDASDWRAVGEPVAWFYDPPWTVPGRRRNEVAVAVMPR